MSLTHDSSSPDQREQTRERTSERERQKDGDRERHKEREREKDKKEIVEEGDSEVSSVLFERWIHSKGKPYLGFLLL